MKRIVWRVGKKQAVMAACVLMGTTLMACGVEASKDDVENVVSKIEETMSNTESVVESSEEQSVVTQTRIEEVKGELSQILEEGRQELRKWNAGVMTGTWGENAYTQTLLQSVKDNGVTDYLTFSYEGKAGYDAAIVIAGVKTEDGIKGSAWHVVKKGGATLLEQSISFSGELLACIENAKECAVFLNYIRDGAAEGRIIGFEDTTPWELLEGVTGVKNVLEDATIEVIAPVVTDLGTAMVRYHYSLEDREFTKLETEVLSGEEYLASVDISKLPWAQEAFHTSTIVRESWDNPSIIGEEYTPEGMEAEILQGLIPDYSTRWDSWFNDYWAKWDSESSYYQIFQIEETESFAIYGTYIDSRMIIETYDDSYVQVNGYFTSNYGTQPQVIEKDFDNDGSLELAIATLTKHGTGVCIYDVWMVDKAEDGKWYVYELQYNWYQELENLFSYQDTQQGLALVVKDEVVAVYSDAAEEASERYGVGDHIYYDFSSEKIMLSALFQVYSEDMILPVYAGGYLVAELGYQGDGKWCVVDYSYESELDE